MNRQTGSFLFGSERNPVRLCDAGHQGYGSPVPTIGRARRRKERSSSPTTNSSVVGVVRIGLTDAQAKGALLIIIRNVALLTLLIIAAGILSAHLLTSRITTPLRSLAGAARQLADGHEAPVPLTASTSDEVGQLTQAFNVMTQSLHERNQAISLNLETIRRQIKQLTTAHKVSTAVASANMFDMNQLLDSVLWLLTENLGFSRMVVFLKNSERNSVVIAQSVGFPPDIQEASRRFEIPITKDSMTAELVILGKPLLIHDLGTVAHRIQQPVLDLMRRSGFSPLLLYHSKAMPRFWGIWGRTEGHTHATRMISTFYSQLPVTLRLLSTMPRPTLSLPNSLSI